MSLKQRTPGKAGRGMGMKANGEKLVFFFFKESDNIIRKSARYQILQKHTALRRVPHSVVCGALSSAAPRTDTQQLYVPLVNSLV